MNLKLKTKMTMHKSFLKIFVSLWILSIHNTIQAEDASSAVVEGKNPSIPVDAAKAVPADALLQVQSKGKNPGASANALEKAPLERSAEVDELAKNLVRPGQLSRQEADDDKNSLPRPLFTAYELPKTIKHFFLYFSASWCPPCQKFTPEFITFYQENKLKEKGIDVIFVSADKNKEAMFRYMRGKKMPWPALDYDKRDLGLIGGLNIENLPGLVLMDIQGNVLGSTQGSDGSTGQDGYTDPRIIMQKALELPGFQQP